MSFVTPMSSVRSLLLILLTVSQVASQTCYMPDGTPNTADYQPCHTGRTSMCCATGRGDSQYLNVCMSDDLCQETGTADNPGTNNIWREGCTDPTWKDPACVKLCVTGFIKNSVNDTFQFNATENHIIITTCPDGSLCCGQNDTACCDKKQGVWLLDDKVYSTKPGSVATSTSSSSSTTTSTQTSSVSPSSSTSAASASKGRALGLGLGLGLGIPALAILGVAIFLFSKKRTSADVDHGQGKPPPTPVELDGNGIHEAEYKAPQELH